MHRVVSVSGAGTFSASTVVDRVTLDANDRQRRRIVLTAEKGTRVLLDFDKPVTLRDGDGLVLEDGSVVLVCGMAEPLAEIAASSPRDFVRLAWHLGNRHTDVQIVGDRIRIRRDHVLEEMLRGLGATVTAVEAPFDPQGTVPHSHAHGDHEHHHHGHYDDHGHSPPIATATIMSKCKTLLLVKGRGERKRSASRSAARHSLPACGEGEEGERAKASQQTAALYRLMAWLSPAFPVGAFSYSSGIEWAVEAGDIKDAATLTDWLSLMMSDGAGFCDAVLFTCTHRAVSDNDKSALRNVAELAAAFSPSKERHLETTAQGRAFIEATRAAWPCEAIERLAAAWDGPVSYPVAVGTVCAGHEIAAEAALPAFLHALAANWISAGVRLIPLGQTDGQRVLATLEEVIAATAARALTASLDDLGGAALRSDLASMRHETQYTRLFRS